MQLTLVEQNDQYTHVSLAGHLDVNGVGKVEARFLAMITTPRKPAIIDMSEVDFVASLGMGMLVSAATKLRHDNAALVLLSPQPLVKQAVTAGGLHELMLITDDMDAALAAIT